jgi:hypothetical protein
MASTDFRSLARRTRLAWTSSRGGGREGQIYLAQWNHQHALDALAPRLHVKKLLEDQHNDDAPNLARDVVIAEADAFGLRPGAWTVAVGRVRAGTGTGDSLENPPLRRDTCLGEVRGTRGRLERRTRAGDYIAAQLARLGAQPLPGRQDMFMSFDFTAGSRDGGSQLSMGTQRFTAPTDVVALSFSDDATVSAPVVFAGYGIVVPESQNFGYDSYATLDVKDKAVVVFRYFPEDADKETKSILARYSDLRYKALAARQRGAKALLVVTGPRSPNAGQTVPITFDTALAGSGIPAASVSGRAAAALFGSRSLESVQKEFDSGNPHAAGFALDGVTIELATKLVREKRTARNVVAYLPATSAVSGVEKPWILIGAHYDHLGLGRNGNSLATGADAGKPHVGADDNASGSAAVLAVAEGVARQKVRRRHVAIALWSAEELGLIGSSAFVNTPPIAVNELAAYLNFDMVGRMQDNKLAVQATAAAPRGRRWSNERTSRLDSTSRCSPIPISRPTSPRSIRHPCRA